MKLQLSIGYFWVKISFPNVDSENNRRSRSLCSEAKLTTVGRPTLQGCSDAKRHDERYLPQIQRIERKMNGVLDPMEETIGLYRVIFVPAPDADPLEPGEKDKKWIAGLFQFLVIFGTLFILDLVPIMTKIFSRAGPYDVLVEHPEFIANANLQALFAEYAKRAADWGITGMIEQPSGPDLVKGRPRAVPGPPLAPGPQEP